MAHLCEEQRHVIAVADDAGVDSTLAAGDVVTFLPAVSGG